ncbi:MAG TPA: TatD family hydrolase [Frankiaceae bacterium]|nr:TatD family hydrolase [Frankiaceae bacterium]
MSRKAGREGDPPPPPEPLRVPAVDSHCHLDLGDPSVAEAIDQAVAAGIPRMVTVGIDVPSSRWCADVAEKHEALLAAVALHPNEAPTATPDDFAEIERLAQLPRVRAIGETGLDHYRTGEDGRAEQEASFRRHIDLAKRAGKALVIHDRNAHADVLRVLGEEGAPERVVFHCFSGDADFARRCVDQGFVLSFAGNVTFKNAGELREAVAVTPRDQLLVETDAPFLTPMPYRGRPNGPYLVPLTVRAVAEVQGVDEDVIAAAVSATAERVFGSWSLGE